MEMVKTAVQRKPNAPVAQDDIERSLAVFAAKRQFISSALTMGWQMAGMVIIPVFIGVRLDDHFDSAPSYTLVALFLAIAGAVMIVRNTVQQVNRDQAEAEAEAAQNKKGPNAQ